MEFTCRTEAGGNEPPFTGDGRALEVCESQKQFQHKPVHPAQPAHVSVGRANLLKAAGSIGSAGNEVVRAGTFCEGTPGPSDQSRFLKNEAWSRAARRNRHQHLAQETTVERHAAMEVRGANPPEHRVTPSAKV